MTVRTPDGRWSNPAFITLTGGSIGWQFGAESTDVVLVFGTGILREALLSAFPGRLINIHLGLSPYYRGAGTNFWPLVNGEPELQLAALPFGAEFQHRTMVLLMAQPVSRGRVWLTTSRGSVKARAWKVDPSVSGLVPG